jgi:hypothetical protein
MYSSSEILKMFLLTVGKGDAKYSTEQACMYRGSKKNPIWGCFKRDSS